jgi:hypothetical protein
MVAGIQKKEILSKALSMELQEPENNCRNIFLFGWKETQMNYQTKYLEDNVIKKEE